MYSSRRSSHFTRVPAVAFCAALFATTTLATATAQVLDTTIESRDTTCYDGVYTIIARGSEETQGQSVLEPIASAVSSAIPNSGKNEVVYPAWISFWNSAPQGVTDAQAQMQNYTAACPNSKIVVMGYSQGSYVMQAALTGGNFSGESWDAIPSNVASNVAAVVLFGDPSRVLGQGTSALGTNCLATCPDEGPLELKSPYNTTFQQYDSRFQSWCSDQDPVCCSTGTNITAHLSYWSDNTTETVVQFVQGLVGTPTNTSSTISSSMSSTQAPSATNAASVEVSAVSSVSVSLQLATGLTTASGAAATSTDAQDAKGSQSGTASATGSAVTASASSTASGLREMDAWTGVVRSSYVALFCTILLSVVILLA